MSTLYIFLILQLDHIYSAILSLIYNINEYLKKDDNIKECLTNIKKDDNIDVNYHII